MINIFLLLGSFLIIWKSADFFVDASHEIALRSKVSPMMIGATVVAFGTSAPELFVNIFAAFDQQPNIIYGNILGSNLANTCLILGSAFTLTPLIIKRNGFQQIISNLLFTGLIGVILMNQWVNRPMAVLILVLFLVIYFFMVRDSSKLEDHSESNHRSILLIVALFFGSLIGLVFSAKLLIYSLLQTASFLGVSTVFLSLFAVALGTSLPELISTIVFVRKGHTDIVIGNVFGSNLFNLMLVLPISWLVHPLQMPTQLSIEFFLLGALLFVIFIAAIFLNQLHRKFGLMLLAMYCLYIIFIYFR